jgi:hypothetical protein
MIEPRGSCTGGGHPMPIRGMVDRTAFNPREVGEMVAAFEATLAALNLVDRSDPITTLIAKVIIDCARTGEIERARLRDCAIKAVTKH